MFSLLIRYIINRASEKSTVEGIILSISSMTGYVLSDTKQTAIICAVIGLTGVLKTVFPDKFPINVISSLSDTNSQPIKSVINTNQK